MHEDHKVIRLGPPKGVYDRAEEAGRRIAKVRLRQPVLNAVRELAVDLIDVLNKTGRTEYDDLFVEFAAGTLDAELSDLIWTEIWIALGINAPAGNVGVPDA